MNKCDNDMISVVECYPAPFEDGGKEKLYGDPGVGPSSRVWTRDQK